MNCDYDGEDMEIGFNARFLTELLSNMYCKNVKFELSAPSRAGILVPDENDEGEVLMMLIMPTLKLMQTSWNKHRPLWLCKTTTPASRYQWISLTKRS